MSLVQRGAAAPDENAALRFLEHEADGGTARPLVHPAKPPGTPQPKKRGLFLRCVVGVERVAGLVLDRPQDDGIVAGVELVEIATGDVLVLHHLRAVSYTHLTLPT